MDTIQLHDKKFSRYIDEGSLKARVKDLAKKMSNDLEGTDLLLLGILNGSFSLVIENPFQSGILIINSPLWRING